MKIAETLKSLQTADPAIALLIGGMLLFLAAGLALSCKPPVLLWFVLMVGSAVATKWSLVNAVGLIGRYPMLIGLAVVALSMRGRYRVSLLGKFYLFYCAVIFVAIFNLPATYWEAGGLWDGLIKVGCFLLAFFGIYVLTQKLVSRPEMAPQILPWFVVWAAIEILVQIPFWGFRDERFTGVYETPGTLQHSLARAVVILLIFVLSRSGRWIIPCIVGVLFSAFMLLLTGGRTAIGSIVLALPFVLRLRPSRAMIVGVVAATLGMATLPALVWKVRGFEHTYAHLLSEDSVRFKWWPKVWARVLEAPLVGHGTNSSEVFTRLGWGKTSHNSYLDLAYDHGIPFTALFIAAMLWAIWRAWRQMGTLPPCVQRELVALAGAFLIMLALEGAFLSDLVRINLKWFLICVCFGILDGVAVWQRNTSPQRLGYPVGESLPLSSAQPSY